MKLRNKHTGEVIKVKGEAFTIFYGEDEWLIFTSLKQLNDTWEDHEEPKEYWYIDANGELLCEPSDDRCKFDNKCREIGNYFETKEEAERAVRKLKAWKRLKDNGFEFRRWEIIDGTINFMILPKGDYREKVYEDLRICFGGEE